MVSFKKIVLILTSDKCQENNATGFITKLEPVSIYIYSIFITIIVFGCGNQLDIKTIQIKIIVLQQIMTQYWSVLYIKISG